MKSHLTIHPLPLGMLFLVVNVVAWLVSCARPVQPNISTTPLPSVVTLSPSQPTSAPPTLPPPIQSFLFTKEPPRPITEEPPRPTLTVAAGSASHSFLPVVNQEVVIPELAVQSGQTAALEGALKKWYPLTLNFTGPRAAETDVHRNPFLDYRLQVVFTSPSGQSYNVPGFFSGDGWGHSRGSSWQARFTPDEVGLWQYQASFRFGSEVAVDLDPAAGLPVAFNGANGAFTIEESDPAAPGFLKWGRLEYVGNHYLKFRDGPYWLKGGANSPENFLGYRGFDNTVDQGGLVTEFLHEYTPHAADWQMGDTYFVSADTRYDAKGIVGALNYLSEQHVNSIYFLPMNLGGDGQDTYPFVGPTGSDFDNTHYDLSKLHQWNCVFEHAQERGIALHVVLNETEWDNKHWLDGGTLGLERKLFYREMVARFGYLLALKWNLSEESTFSMAQLRDFADYIQALDWARHPIAVHTPHDDFSVYEPFLGDTRLTATSMQYNPDRAGEYVETWRVWSTAAGRPWVIDMDENNPAGVGLTPANAVDMRKRVLYDVYFSGGNIEWYLGYHDLPVGGDVQLEDFRTREAMWNYMWYARRFMEENLPFWEMEPADHLLTGEASDYGGGEVFAKPGQVFAVYLPNAVFGGYLDMTGVEERVGIHWYNPRTGRFVGEPTIAEVSDSLFLGYPPEEPNQDWVVLITVFASERLHFLP